jgi:hypothetical protein
LGLTAAFLALAWGELALGWGELALAWVAAFVPVVSLAFVLEAALAFDVAADGALGRGPVLLPETGLGPGSGFTDRALVAAARARRALGRWGRVLGRLARIPAPSRGSAGAPCLLVKRSLICPQSSRKLGLCELASEEFLAGRETSTGYVVFSVGRRSTPAA